MAEQQLKKRQSLSKDKFVQQEHQKLKELFKTKIKNRYFAHTQLFHKQAEQIYKLIDTFFDSGSVTRDALKRLEERINNNLEASVQEVPMPMPAPRPAQGEARRKRPQAQSYQHNQRLQLPNVSDFYAPAVYAALEQGNSRNTHNSTNLVSSNAPVPLSKKHQSSQDYGANGDSRLAVNFEGDAGNNLTERRLERRGEARQQRLTVNEQPASSTHQAQAALNQNGSRNRYQVTQATQARDGEGGRVFVAAENSASVENLRSENVQRVIEKKKSISMLDREELAEEFKALLSLDQEKIRNERLRREYKELKIKNSLKNEWDQQLIEKNAQKAQQREQQKYEMKSVVQYAQRQQALEEKRQQERLQQLLESQQELQQAMQQKNQHLSEQKRREQESNQKILSEYNQKVDAQREERTREEMQRKLEFQQVLGQQLSHVQKQRKNRDKLRIIQDLKNYQQQIQFQEEQDRRRILEDRIRKVRQNHRFRIDYSNYQEQDPYRYVNEFMTDEDA